MDAETIRQHLPSEGNDNCAALLNEIAAQLAELNDFLRQKEREKRIARTGRNR